MDTAAAPAAGIAGEPATALAAPETLGDAALADADIAPDADAVPMAIMPDAAPAAPGGVEALVAPDVLPTGFTAEVASLAGVDDAFKPSVAVFSEQAYRPHTRATRADDRRGVSKECFIQDGRSRYRSRASCARGTRTAKARNM